MPLHSGAFGRTVVILLLWVVSPLFADFINFESGQVRPLELAAEGDRLYAVNTPDNRVEVFAPTPGGLRHLISVPVGMEPVALALRENGDLWVVNHLSDSISIVDTRLDPPRVVRTLLVGDEPRDIVFACAERERAFITTAHRGQSVPFDPQLEVDGIGRADVWVFAADDLGVEPWGSPETIVTLFADTPRALAVSPDRRLVYAASFHSGNGTSIVSEAAVCDGGAEAPPCVVDGLLMPGGLPSPNQNIEGVPAPETGLIVRRDPVDGSWLDELDRDWSSALRIDLPDKDVFVLDATADPPIEVSSYRGVGTILYNMVANPVTGHVYVTNTEARNQVRFEPRLRGHQHESQISVLGSAAVEPRRLNVHLDYSRNDFSNAERDATVALPTGMAIRSDGTVLYVAALGSDLIAVVDVADLEAGRFVPEAAEHIRIPAGGPTGLVFDEGRERLYVMSRFSNSVETVDIAKRKVIGSARMHSAEPASVAAGRRFHYDAFATSGNGEAACASCHVFGDVDGLAWDLGNPADPVVENANPAVANGVPLGSFHPLKGPMVTQTFRGMVDSGPMHWRGDRTEASADGGNGLDSRAAFLTFNESFVSLLGRGEALTAAEMNLFADFALSVTLPPNPVRALDSRLSDDQERAAEVFFERENCTTCHEVDPSMLKFGTAGRSAFNPNPGSRQAFKVPHLRGLYQKVGYFGIFPIPRGLEEIPQGFLGDQVRGFGFLNDGAGILPPETAAFLLAFDSNLAPVVGQQVTVGADTIAAASVRISLFRERARAGDCDLIVKGVLDGTTRGWLYLGNAILRSDQAEDPWLNEAELHEFLDGGRMDHLTYTCVPPGLGIRSAIDRDGDGALDHDEILSGSDPADPGSLPGSVPATPTPVPERCVGDCDWSGTVTVDEVIRAVAIALGTAAVRSCEDADANSDGEITVDEIVLTVTNALMGCPV